MRLQKLNLLIYCKLVPYVLLPKFTYLTHLPLYSSEIYTAKTPRILHWSILTHYPSTQRLVTCGWFTFRTLSVPTSLCFLCRERKLLEYQITLLVSLFDSYCHVTLCTILTLFIFRDPVLFTLTQKFMFTSLGSFLSFLKVRVRSHIIYSWGFL